MSYYPTLSKQEELERFKKASAALERRAEKDRNVAREFLREIGYFEIMSQADPGPIESFPVKKTSRARKSIKSK